MEFSCSKDVFDKQLQYVSRVVTVRPGMPVLSHILLETDKNILRMSATDLEIAITTHIPAEISQEGTFTVPAKLFQEFIHQNPDERISFSLESNELVCTSTKVTARIPGLDPDEYPALPLVKPGASYRLPFQDLIQAFRQVVVACAHDSARPILTGVYIKMENEHLTCAATDSFRLGEKKVTLSVPTGDAKELILPSRTVQELIRIGATLPDVQEIEVELDDQQALFRIDSVELYSRLLIGSFPNYHAIIPKQTEVKAEVMTSELVQSLRLLNVFSQSGIANVLFEITEAGEMNVSNYGSGRGTTVHTLYAVIEPGFVPLKVAFNAKFLLDACGVVQADHLDLLFSGSTKPLVIESEDPTHFQLVMPIRLT